jgi:predicted phosphohydrolase
MTELLQRYGVDTCYYGHLHGEAIRGAFNGVKNGVSYRLISADALSFRPVRIL